MKLRSYPVQYPTGLFLFMPLEIYLHLPDLTAPLWTSPSWCLLLVVFGCCMSTEKCFTLPVSAFLNDWKGHTGQVEMSKLLREKEDSLTLYCLVWEISIWCQLMSSNLSAGMSEQMPPEDLYSVLGAGHSDSPQQLKDKYKQLALKVTGLSVCLHPVVYLFSFFFHL